jgi:signal transduction histidine kinase
MSKSAPAERLTMLYGEDPRNLARVDPEFESEAAIGMLAMSVVHDLRNPLTTIHTGAEMLNASELSREQVRRLARNICAASVTIQQLLEDYVDICRTREARAVAYNLRRLVANCIDRIEDRAGVQSVTVAYDVPADLMLTMDYRRIVSVLGNLLDNALEAMPAGGSIHISAVVAENWAVLKVLDTGSGIAPEIRDRLFEPFVTARKPNGWGLGLTHARQAIQQHGGEIWLEDSPGWGTCFAFSLPLDRREEGSWLPVRPAESSDPAEICR